MKLKLISLLLFSFLLSSELFAQNFLVNHNTSAFHVNAFYGSTNGTSTKILGIAPGFTFNGRTTMSIGLAKTYIRDFDKLNTLRFSASYLAIKPFKDSNVFNLSFDGAYEITGFDNDEISNMRTISAAITCYRKFALAERTYSIPSLSIGWQRAEVATFTNGGVLFRIQTTILHKNLHFTPNLEYFDKNTSFGMTLGILLPLKTK